MALHRENNIIGIGLVIHDWTGSALLSLMKPLKYVVDPAVAELRGLLEVVFLYRDLGFTNCFSKGFSILLLLKYVLNNAPHSDCQTHV